MLHTEFVRNINCNYERILLEEKPEERKYQYCILNRGGIKGLLSCSLRYINGQAYLYYDITSKQTIAQRYGERIMTRECIQDFVWSLQRIQMELSRFLLDVKNIMWYPQQVFQDLESQVFSFLYIPYCGEENGFLELLEFMVEHIDYEDEVLVEFVYKMYEQYEQGAMNYLAEQIFEDAKILEQKQETRQVDRSRISIEQMPPEATKEKEPEIKVKEKKGFLSILDGRKRKQREIRENYQRDMQQCMAGYAVAEESTYEDEEWGRTIYIEESASEQEKTYGLYTLEGKLLIALDRALLTIGKKRDEVDLVVDDLSVSRIHARILVEQEHIYIEDMNSTNGTFKNGLRLQPYEKRILEEGDEIKIGKKVLLYQAN